MATMTVSLPDPIAEWIEAQVETGAFATSSDYLADLIRRDRERRGVTLTMDELRQRIADSKASGISSRDVEAIFAQAQGLVRARTRG